MKLSVQNVIISYDIRLFPTCKQIYFLEYLQIYQKLKMTQHKLYLLIFGLILAISIQSQLLAIDFGTQFIKASVVHSGAGKSFSIVENSKSQRKFLNALGFFNEQRFYENDALPKRTKVPQNCFLYSRMLIDFAKKPSLISVVKKDLFLEYINQNTEDQLMAQFILKNFPKQTNELTLLQVMTMILKYVKLQAQKYVKSQIKDVVLILPNYWSIHQRNFLLQAASMAEIYILSIISQNTAASINYALSQRTNNKTQNVLFYNVGSNALQMTLVQYKQVLTQSSPKPIESIFVKDDYGKPYLGGLRLDSIICKYFEEQFEHKYKKKLDKKGLIKLLAESNRAKETLTSNKQASLFVQGIMDGIDFHSKISRTEFEKRSAQVFKELTSPLKRFLLDNDLKADDLHSVQLIGGGSRIPKLQSMIVQILNNQKEKIGTHINGDQAMALGGAFFAANSSKKFKVKGINLYDGFNFDIRLVLRNLNTDLKQSDESYFYKNATIFKKKSRYGLIKEVNFKCVQNLRADLYSVDTQTLEQELLKSYEFDQIQSFNESDFKLSLVFTVDTIEVVQLKDSKFTYKKDEIQTYVEKVKKQKTKNEKQAQDKSNMEQQQQKQKQNDTQPASELNEQTQSQDHQGAEVAKQEKAEQSQDDQSTQKEKNQQSANMNQQSANINQQSANMNQQSVNIKQQSANMTQQSANMTQQSANKTSRKKSVKNKKQRVQYQTVQKNKTISRKYAKQLKAKLSYNVNSFQQKLNQRTRKMLRNYQSAQQSKRSLSESRNKLQALIYETNDKLESQQFIRYSKEGQRQHLRKLAQQKQQWHDQSDSKNPEDYKRKHNELHKPLQKVKRRIIQHYERQHIRGRALSLLKEHLNLTEKIQKGKQWITDQEVQDLKQTFEQAKNKIKDIFNSMKQTPLNEDSIYKNKDMIKQAETAKDKYFVLKAKPKPTKKEERKQQESASDEQTESEGKSGKQQKQQQSEVGQGEL